MQVVQRLARTMVLVDIARAEPRADLAPCALFVVAVIVLINELLEQARRDRVLRDGMLEVQWNGRAFGLERWWEGQFVCGTDVRTFR